MTTIEATQSVSDRKIEARIPIPERMNCWILTGPGEIVACTKPVPLPGPAEVLVRIDAVAICATDLEIIQCGSPAMIDGDLPFNKGFTPGHEYMGTVAALGRGVDEFKIGERVTVEIHAGCGRCPRCRSGMYTSCLNYGHRDKGHRANGFTTDGGFAEFAVNHVNTLVRVPNEMSDEEATLVVTAGTSMYGLTELGGLVAGESVVVLGPGPIGLLAVGVAKALGARPVILVGTRLNRLAIGQKLGADAIINIADDKAPDHQIRALTGGIGADYVIECAGTEDAIGLAVRTVSRGGKICLAAFPHQSINLDIAQLVRNNVAVFGIRGEGRSATHRALALMAERRFNAGLIHTHTFGLTELPTALRYARDRVEDAIKVVVKIQHIF
jgi:L-iditol 2-dehydrogenase